MPIDFTCPHCGKQTYVADQFADHTGPCAACGQTITIPAKTALMKAHPLTKSSGTVRVVEVALVMLVVGGIGILVTMLLLPVSRSRAQCSNNLKQIGLAMNMYHDVYSSLPPAYVTDEDGKPLYSWRVLLLPFLEQGPLYDAFDLDQPWDSPKNLSLSERIVKRFNCHLDSVGNHTNYMVVTGPGTLFVDDEAISFQEITDGLSTTILVVEVVDQGVSWAEPFDLDFDRFARGSDLMYSRHPGGAHVLMADGTVYFLTDATDPEMLRAMITPAGGEKVRLP